MQVDRLGGFVDGLQGSDLIGWIANHDRPERLEEVFCSSTTGTTVRFRTFIYRHDVAQVLSLNGKFGFAIPLNLIKHLGPCITVSNRYGDILNNGSFILPKLNTEPDSKWQGAYVFIHIQKTAGTSVRVALQQQFSQSEVALIYPGVTPGMSIPELISLPIRQRQNIRLLVGHMHFGAGRFLANTCRYIAFLRNPISRLRSHYWHHRIAGSKFRQDGREVPLSQVLNEVYSEEFDNLQTRYIAGVSTDSVPLGHVSLNEVELALFNIREYFAFVGTVETIDADFPALLHAIGKNGRLETFNRTPSELLNAEDEDFMAVDWPKVQETNKYDAILYSEVAKLRVCAKNLRRIAEPS